MGYKKEVLYNYNKLIKIEICDVYKSKFYEYRHEKKLFGLKIQSAGCYHKISGQLININKKMYTITNNIVCEKAKCILYFQDHQQEVIYFDSYEEAKNKGTEIIGQFRHLIVNYYES